MPQRIEEKTLILPALYIIQENPNISTSNLIKQLELIFKPTGEDAKILSNRSDSKFSQKVRNLKSHRDNNRMSEWTIYSSGKYIITDSGKEHIQENITLIQYLFENNFTYSDVQNLINSANESTKTNRILIYDEKDIVSEGKSASKTSVTRQRSRKLREAAIAYYTDVNGHIPCCICSFDFISIYGQIGEGSIVIHHEKPIFQYSNDDFESSIKDAILNMKPVCPNCHTIIHKKVKEPLSIEQLKAIINK